jgi:hypothetical protein
MRPWLPGHSGTRRYWAARPGTQTKQPASRENPASGHIRRVWQVMGSNHRRLSRRFYRPSLLAEAYAADQRVRAARHASGPPPSAMRPLDDAAPGGLEDPPVRGRAVAPDVGRRSLRVRAEWRWSLSREKATSPGGAGPRGRGGCRPRLGQPDCRRCSPRAFPRFRRSPRARRRCFTKDPAKLPN